MADGTIKIDIEVDGKPVKVASKELDGMDKAAKNSGKGIKAAEDSMDGLANSSKKASNDVKKAKDQTKGTGDEAEKAGSKVKKFATALGLVAVGAAAFSALKASMDTAISRFDTLNKFPKVLSALGVSAEDSEKAMNKLSDGIDGLPTTLNDIAGNAQRMYTSFNDMDKAADTALALNNALLGSGSSAEDAQRGTEQYLQALQRGKFEMEEWKTLQETMDIGLIKVADSMGYTGKTAKQDLYAALQDGTVTMDQFNNKLIEVGTGTGIMADLAKENSLGLATSIGNLKNAAAKGIANIIDSFNKLSIEVTGKDIAQNIDGLKAVVNASFNTIGSVIEGTAPIVKGFGMAVQVTLPVIEALAPALIGAATAYAGLMIINKVSSAIKASNAVLNTAMASQKALTIATKAQITAQMASTAATKADAVATVAQTGAVKLSTIAIGVLTGKLTIARAAAIAFAAAKKLMMGPIGWVTAGIGALAGAVVGIVKWFNKETEEAKKLNAETEKLSESTDQLNESIKESSEAHKQQQNEMKASAEANSVLAEKVEELAAKENKSAADKALLQSYIESLNGSIDGLSLAYDEEANSLNMSSKELQARLDLMKETEAGLAAQERLTEIINEQNEAQMKLDEINAKRDEWNKKLEEGSVKASEHKDKIAELDEKELALKETLAILAEQYGITEQQIITASENATAAVEAGNLRQITSYKELEDHHKAVFDNMKSKYDELVENATNAFDRMNSESKVSAEEMLANLEHNAEMTRQWGEDVAKLMEYAGKDGNDGFLQWLDTMGPESAAELAEVANMSEPELDRFIELMNEAPQVAGEGFKTALGEEFDDAVDVMINFVDDGSQTLREQIKSSGFDKIGSMVPEGFVKGAEDGIPDVERAMEGMAEKAIHSTKEALDINSPSKEYQKLGAAPFSRSTEKTKSNSELGARVIRTMKFKEVVVV